MSFTSHVLLCFPGKCFNVLLHRNCETSCGEDYGEGQDWSQCQWPTYQEGSFGQGEVHVLNKCDV